MIRWLWLLPLFTGCTEYGYTANTRVDVFEQQQENQVDLLVVVDNSCSMWEEQDSLARNFDALLQAFAAAEVDWQVAVTTTDTESERYKGLLMAGDDEIVLRGAGGELDRVEYDRDWGFVEGVAMQLDGKQLAVTSNDSLSSWCPATEAFGDGGLGTPGVPNASCKGKQVPRGSGPDAGPRPAVVGDLVISEIMATVADARCEWVEVTNTSHDTLDLGGVEVLDAGRNAAVVPDGVQLAPDAALVLGRSERNNCGAPVDVVLAEGFTLNDDVRVLTPDTPDADELFAEQVAQGTIGVGVEMGLEAARLALSEPAYSDQNGTWLRDDASLAMLFVSDEDDASPYPVRDYLRYFEGLKGDVGYRDARRVTLSAVVGKDAPANGDYATTPGCTSDNGVAFYGRRYLLAATETGGLVESICAEDFAPIVSQLGLTLSGLVADFHLGDLPKLSTLVVRLYADASDDSLVGELTLDVDFSYVAEGNMLHFEDAQVPPSGSYVTAEYQVLPEGSVISEASR